MRALSLSTAFLLLESAITCARATPIDTEQQPLVPQNEVVRNAELLPGRVAGRKLHGRFLHITDFHPDPFYKLHSTPKSSCHRGSGAAGFYGAETSDCDSPFSLVNETFKWIDANLKDSIDFVIWTGDSARHDNDEKLPRSDKQVFGLNEYVVEKFVEVFGKDDNINDTDPNNDMTIPIIPNFGNNDILPHNIMSWGPNKFTMEFSKIWERFIPEDQRHVFQRGGWFWVEVIPNELAVFSLNTLYFFDSNAAVDGCALKSEPGYEQMEWMRIQLEFARERGMKAILMGHVPPSRTDSKSSWDETCWQKYTLWLHRYRDVVVGSLFGHMNIDHFMLQDSRDINIPTLDEDLGGFRTAMESELSIESAADYLTELRDKWARLPSPPPKEPAKSDEELRELSGSSSPSQPWRLKKKKHRKSADKYKKYLEKIGGKWGERYSISHVTASVVPNYLPSFRVYEYNVTGLEDVTVSGSYTPGSDETLDNFDDLETSSRPSAERRRKEKKDKNKKGGKGREKGKEKYPHLIVPNPPSKSSPPGPAYSPQTLSLLGFTQYVANLTYINNDFMSESPGMVTERWREGIQSEKGPYKKHPKPEPKKFEYEAEYDTLSDPVYKMKDMTVRSYLKLARRIGKADPSRKDTIEEEEPQDNIDVGDTQEDDSDVQQDLDGSKKKHKKHRKHRKHKKGGRARNKVWFTFLKRAFVGTMEDEDIHDRFGEIVEEERIEAAGEL
ncbi:hypothetical protein FGG08_006707 [Glutinoglossum americanum]|uniref:Endopolyphosphatase n=1 Tax=Glutinoglossum americanum TaxID=1670608 RepID=A0A9P8KX65_9PEZI|nr:hypothetical protein FGG08_006707 [Glutinoglossum americanum]